MKDHQPGCKILITGECTCLDTNEMLVLRRAKDKLDVNYTVLSHKYHQVKVGLWIMGLCFLFAVVFNAVFMYLLWFGRN